MRGTTRGNILWALDVENPSGSPSKGYGLSLSGQEHIVNVSAYGLDVGVITNSATGCTILNGKYSTVTSPVTLSSATTKCTIIDANNAITDNSSSGTNVILGSAGIRSPQGATGSRPSATTAKAGSMWYDTTLGLPIWSNGTTWTDAVPSTLTDKTLVNPALGTPASGTLTNATGLPVTGITASTSAALGVGSLELGHASDTTLSRSSAGVLAVEGVEIPTVSSTSTLTSKTLTSPKLNEILDTNGNTSVVLGATASAVNYLQINNAAAGVSAGGFVAAGASTDLNIDFTPTGVGVVRVNGVPVVTTTGTVTMTNKTLTSPKISSGSAPASAAATGTAGQIQWDTDYIYVCTATNTWKRVAIATW